MITGLSNGPADMQKTCFSICSCVKLLVFYSPIRYKTVRQINKTHISLSLSLSLSLVQKQRKEATVFSTSSPQHLLLCLSEKSDVDLTKTMDKLMVNNRILSQTMITNWWLLSLIVYNNGLVNARSGWSLKCWFYWISGKIVTNKRLTLTLIITG